MIGPDAASAPGSRIGLASGEWLQHAANLIGLALGCRAIALHPGEALAAEGGDGGAYVTVAPGIDQASAVFHDDTPECPKAAATLPGGTRACAIVPLPRRNVDGVHWSIDGDIELRVLWPVERGWSDEERVSLCTVVDFLGDDLDVRFDLSLCQRAAEELRVNSLHDT